MAKAFYDKFTQKKASVIKEEHIQKRRKYKKERAAFFEQKRNEKFAAQQEEKTAPQKFPQQKSNIKPNNKEQQAVPTKTGTSTEMPLNKYLAHCGVSSRRDAAESIKKEIVKVNGKIVTEPGYKVKSTDEVIFNGKKVSIVKNLVYILLNKPKDYLTTNDDPQDRKTVLHLIKKATTERVYPIGRLDRNTSGVLLLTNDGDLTQKLSHPSFGIKKIYEAKLNKELTKQHFEKILGGLKLEDGMIKVDSLAYADPNDKCVIGIEIHSGKNRIVRRIFESLGYDVRALDRVMFANLTKKNVDRGKWRLLSEKEIRLLKYMNNSKKKENA